MYNALCRSLCRFAFAVLASFVANFLFDLLTR